jgi:hypothetical protein
MARKDPTNITSYFKCVIMLCNIAKTSCWQPLILLLNDVSFSSMNRNLVFSKMICNITKTKTKIIVRTIVPSKNIGKMVTVYIPPSDRKSSRSRSCNSTSNRLVRSAKDHTINHTTVGACNCNRLVWVKKENHGGVMGIELYISF